MALLWKMRHTQLPALVLGGPRPVPCLKVGHSPIVLDVVFYLVETHGVVEGKVVGTSLYR